MTFFPQRRGLTPINRRAILHGEIFFAENVEDLKKFSKFVAENCFGNYCESATMKGFLIVLKYF